MDSGLCHPRDGEVGRLLQQEEKAAEGAENGSGDEDLLMRLSVQVVTSTLHASHHNYVDLVWTGVHRNHYSSIYCRSFIIYTVYAYCIYIHMYSLGC